MQGFPSQCVTATYRIPLAPAATDTTTTSNDTKPVSGINSIMSHLKPGAIDVGVDAPCVSMTHGPKVVRYKVNKRAGHRRGEQLGERLLEADEDEEPYNGLSTVQD